MTKIKTLGAAFLLLVLTSFTSDSLPKKFSDLLNRTNMTFEKPIGLEEIKVIGNRQMEYEYALKYPNKKFGLWSKKYDG